MDSFTYKVLHERDKYAAMVQAFVRRFDEEGSDDMQDLIVQARELIKVKLLETEPQTLPAAIGQSQPDPQPTEGLRLPQSGLRLQKPHQ